MPFFFPLEGRGWPTCGTAPTLYVRVLLSVREVLLSFAGTPLELEYEIGETLPLFFPMSLCYCAQAFFSRRHVFFIFHRLSESTRNFSFFGM